MLKTSRVINNATEVPVDTTIDRGANGLGRITGLIRMTATKALVAAYDNTANQNRYQVVNL